VGTRRWSYNSDLQKYQAKYFCIQGLTWLLKIRIDLPQLRQPPSSEGGLRRVKRLRRARGIEVVLASARRGD
jgi:hypothetical protein